MQPHDDLSINELLFIDEREIRRHGPGNIVQMCWRQWRTERALRRRGVHFRTTDPEAAQAAYAAMSDQEFDAINGRQEWANWRTIPRALSGEVPNRPLRVLDLGCGTGSSTRVLAFYCPPGSLITGYELARPLVDVARRRQYRHETGQPAQVRFVCQGVTETWRDPDGTPVPDHSVDVVNASGVVGHHLNTETIPPLVQEVKRVLRRGGLALLDVGPTLGDRELTHLLTTAGFRRLGRWRSWAFDPTGQVVFQLATDETRMEHG
jgi:SAM-dependent methyltransferase